MTYKYAMQMFPIKNKPKSIFVAPTDTNFDYDNCIIEVANLVTPDMAKELKEYINSVEILNRQSLPLQPNYNQKVQQYFKNDD